MPSMAIADPESGDYRVGSAAGSGGQEVYRIATVLAERPGDVPWEIVGADPSMRVPDQARSGLDPLEQRHHVPEHHLHRHCLKWIGSQPGALRGDRPLRRMFTFLQANLIEPLPEFGQFDLFVLRNVMIHFDQDTRRRLVGRTVDLLRTDGHHFVGHAESLNGVADGLRVVQPAVYRR